MTSANYSTVLDQPPHTEWSLIRDFNNYPAAGDPDLWLGPAQSGKDFLNCDFCTVLLINSILDRVS